MGDVLLIDATCVLCNRLAKFIGKRQSKRTSLEIYGIEEERGEEIIAGLQPSLQQADSMYLIRDGRPYIRSAASIRLLLYLRWYYAMWFPFAWLVPLPLRNGVYRLVSRYRHRLFGE
ncbi:MAG: hypothetical protein CMA10_00330 [Euryarchaeota archaeon]|nr:hypothetical protein [Euryarchaeota archaeon]|tara:strand:+ start:1060 stop:1410 length:351 start_codon:yes stop_codon:yes gene_type:complete